VSAVLEIITLLNTLAQLAQSQGLSLRPLLLAYEKAQAEGRQLDPAEIAVLKAAARQSLVDLENALPKG